MGAPKDGEFTCRECGKGGFPTAKAVTEHRKTDCPGNPLKVENERLNEELDSMTAERDGLKVVVETLQSTITEMKEGTREEASLESIQRMATELELGFLIVHNSRFLVIPNRFLPDETKYLGEGKYVGIKARGYLCKDGLEVQEAVELIR